MTTWIQITPDDLNDYLVAAQVSALRERALGDGQDDPVAEVIADTTRLIRAEIATHPLNRLSATALALPPELKSTACHLAIEAAQARIPGFGLTEDQAKLAAEAHRLLERIAKGQRAVSQPDDPESTRTYSAGGQVTLEHSRANPLRSDTLKGL